eukprot:scaffold33748_cov146-Isochrysis_galbana.AAC.1
MRGHSGRRVKRRDLVLVQCRFIIRKTCTSLGLLAQPWRWQSIWNGGAPMLRGDSGRSLCDASSLREAVPNALGACTPPRGVPSRDEQCAVSTHHGWALRGVPLPQERAATFSTVAGGASRASAVMDMPSQSSCVRHGARMSALSLSGRASAPASPAPAPGAVELRGERRKVSQSWSASSRAARDWSRKKASRRTGSSHHSAGAAWSAVGSSPTAAGDADPLAPGEVMVSSGFASTAWSASASVLAGRTDDCPEGRTRGAPDAREEVGLSGGGASSSSRFKRADVMAARLRASSKFGCARPCARGTTERKRGIGPVHEISCRGAGGVTPRGDPLTKARPASRGRGGAGWTASSAYSSRGRIFTADILCRFALPGCAHRKRPPD